MTIDYSAVIIHFAEQSRVLCHRGANHDRTERFNELIL